MAILVNSSPLPHFWPWMHRDRVIADWAHILCLASFCNRKNRQKSNSVQAKRDRIYPFINLQPYNVFGWCGHFNLPHLSARLHLWPRPCHNLKEETGIVCHAYIKYSAWQNAAMWIDVETPAILLRLL